MDNRFTTEMEMENPVYKMKFIMGMNLLEMNSVPINVRNILKKIYSNGFKRNDEFDLDKLIIKIYDLQDHEKSLEKKKFIMKLFVY